ncbi:Stress response regulator protein 1 [Spathaspora sp. JA1]|nr:Stress response regulator protein 1 [Spathaspora sp. JA1]
MFAAEFSNPFQQIPFISNDVPVSPSTSPITHICSLPATDYFTIKPRLSIDVSSDKSDSSSESEDENDYHSYTPRTDYTPLTPYDSFPSPNLETYFPSKSILNLVIPNFTPYKFLLVDDNLINLKILNRVLLKIYPRAEITPITDSTQVKALVDSTTFDVVFLDIEMPKVNGIELVQHMRYNNKFNDWGVIAVTTLTSARDLRMYKQCGFDYTFDKPMKGGLREIGRVIDEIIDQRKYHKFT